ncbi:hypothetical protein DK419_13155 [Methylobacterium terrae]|uniref:Uncharacterized protein n=1 Tax=Methylobacterium terrae TaxID=2202827 RepID=A0A2U8WLM3_9HYPH|nr:hypothetical protein [Methylobacterium terrae]AWN47144.1 hypothetical protein DK419_13155 [Methylobacterium terrae]
MTLPATLTELRALPLFDSLPAGCIAHPVADNEAAPHLRLGEFAVIDTVDRDPIHGELFVIRYRSPVYDLGYRDRIVQTNLRVYRSPAGEDVRWWACPYQRPRSLDELHQWLNEGRMVGLSDGPYCPGMLEEKLVGRVVGLLASAVEGPRLALPRRSRR